MAISRDFLVIIVCLCATATDVLGANCLDTTSKNDAKNCLTQTGLQTSSTGISQVDVDLEELSYNSDLICKNLTQAKKAVTCVAAVLRTCTGKTSYTAEDGQLTDGQKFLCDNQNGYNYACVSGSKTEINGCVLGKQTAYATKPGKKTTDEQCQTHDFQAECSKKFLEKCGEKTRTTYLNLFERLKPHHTCGSTRPETGILLVIACLIYFLFSEK